jgi:hypothetical protein
MVLGRSGVIGPDGLVLSSAGRYVGMSLATVDLDQTRIAHAFCYDGEVVFRRAMLGDRRPAAYRLIADESIVPPPLGLRGEVAERQGGEEARRRTGPAS